MYVIIKLMITDVAFGRVVGEPDKIYRFIEFNAVNALAEFILNIDRWFDCMNAGK